MTASGLSVHGLTVGAGTFRLEDLHFDIPIGSWVVLMGRTGCGKTTLLETLCGLRQPQSGSIRIEGRDVTHDTPGSRGIGYVPQDGALFSRATVSEHLAFALTVGPRPRADRNAIQDRVHELAGMLRIEHLLDRRPRGLSGGEGQRVALGRALAHRPAVLLLDEPLSALDEETRDEMYDLIGVVRAETRVTALHVTHSRTEALRLGDQRLILAQGHVRPVADDAEHAMLRTLSSESP